MLSFKIDFKNLTNLKETFLKLKMRVITHNGKIHADECASVSLLSSYFSNKGINVSVLRTRDADKFLPTDCLIDVGGEYDHSKLRYDHHQIGYNEVWNEEFNIPLSSVGLVWRHYGKEIVEMYLSNNVEQYDHAFNYTETTISELMDVIYEKLIMEIDANDNGIILQSNNLNICEIIEAVNGNVNDDAIQNLNFNRAVALIGNIFDIKFREIINGYFNFHRDLNIVFDLLTDRDLENGYLVLKKNIPTIFKCLNEIDREEKIRFCIFCGEEEYTIKTRRTNNTKFSPLCPILNEDVLREEVNSGDIIFIHKASFLAKTKTLEAATEIVLLSLEADEPPALEECIEECHLLVEKENEQLFKSVKKEHKVVAGLALGGLLAYFYFKND